MPEDLLEKLQSELTRRIQEVRAAAVKARLGSTNQQDQNDSSDASDSSDAGQTTGPD